MQQNTTSTPVGDSNEHITNMTRKGQVTVPARMRRHLRLTENDRFAVTLEGAEIRLRKIGSIAQSTHGVVSPVGKTADLAKLRAAFEQSAGREVKAK